MAALFPRLPRWSIAILTALVAVGGFLANALDIEPRTTYPDPVVVAIDYGPAADEVGRQRDEVEVAHRHGMTVLDALQHAADVSLTEDDPLHPDAIDAINGVRTDLEQSRFWVFSVDGEHATDAADLLVLEPGQKITWEYVVPDVTVVIDYGADAGLSARAIREVQIPFVDGMNALDALQAAANVELTQVDPSHPAAVDAVDGVRTDLEASRFWVYEVNGRAAMVMAQDFELGAGFEVRWEYMVPPVTVTIDYGAEVGLSSLAKRTAEVPFTDGMTALDAVQAVADVALTRIDPRHPAAVDAVDGVKTDLEASRFWVYDVNGQMAEVMAQENVLRPGYSVDWKYITPNVTVVIDYGPMSEGPFPRANRTEQIAFADGITALAALRQVAQVELTQVDPNHPMAVDAVDGVRTDLERGRFWVYEVNGQIVEVMAQDSVLKPGFEVRWSYQSFADQPADDAAAEAEADVEAAERIASNAAAEAAGERITLPPARIDTGRSALGFVDAIDSAGGEN